jgi:BlaI family transcriptional regulator, penicillinase repressor
MQVLGLFDGKARKTVTDVRTELQGAGAKLAYTTVMTVLSRLHEKGVLTRERDGKRFYYAAARRTPEVAAGMVARVHRALFKTARMRPIAALLDEQELSTTELRALRSLVDAKLKERK